MLELDALTHEQDFTDQQSRLLLLVPRWRLRDLSGFALAAASEALGEAMTSYVTPIFELRDPVNLSNFRAAVAGQVDGLLAMSLTTPLEDTLASFGQLALAARNALTAAQFEPPANLRRTVVIAIPRDPVATCGNRPCDYLGLWRSVPQTAAQGFWQAALPTPSTASITLTPADLYSAAGGASHFSCQDTAPVLRRAALYLDTDGYPTDLSVLGHEVFGTAGAGAMDIIFPLVGRLLSLRSDSADGVPLALPTLNGSVVDIVPRFGSSSELGAGAGLSPFTTFTLNMSAFASGEPKNVLGAARAAFLVLEVERRISTNPIALPGICQPVLPATP
jgi:hypothetical protein